jgi:hypothetical protein
MEKMFSLPEFEKKVFYFFDECNKLPDLNSEIMLMQHDYPFGKITRNNFIYK